jgi:hypothetical protein
MEDSSQSGDNTIKITKSMKRRQQISTITVFLRI